MSTIAITTTYRAIGRIPLPRLLYIVLISNLRATRCERKIESGAKLLK